MAAWTDGRIEHDDTLPQFRTDETALPIRDLNARGVWCRESLKTKVGLVELKHQGSGRE
jgi:hypothetical protein